MDDELKKQKIREYEEFIDKRLKKDLQKAEDARNAVQEQLTSFDDLRKNIESLQGDESLRQEFRTMVNLGSDVYAEAKVEDTSHVYVDVGLGFYLGFTLQEALGFIANKKAMLQANVDAETKQIAQIKAHIKLVCEGIFELMGLPESDRVVRRAGGFGRE
eukprot:jgi/Mesvir1/23611/Mv18293-RA.1